ncbi:hypothetical protein [Halovenus salina]|uniref:GyrI-like small molecule binding domain-containing protein n=1 Tax=Halovenus salina TaxID=1510225 RepID=A0ABD5W4X5_9EURY|nr:hypothetical protein [Halovenus salina]
MAEPKVSGKFVQGFANSAGEVSPVFERKLRKYLQEHGIEEIDSDSWYNFDQFWRSTNDVEDAVGEMTSVVGGRTMVALIEPLDGSQSLAETMEIADEANRNAYRNFSVESAGHWSYEETEDGFRLATIGGWRHPAKFTKGIMEGFVENSIDYEMDNLEQTRPQSDEVYAFFVPK